MKHICQCPPNSPFRWRDSPRLSIFAQDPALKAAATLSHNQTMVVERERKQGRDISHIAGLSTKTPEQRLIDFKQFTVFSRA